MPLILSLYFLRAPMVASSVAFTTTAGEKMLNVIQRTLFELMRKGVLSGLLQGSWRFSTLPTLFHLRQTVARTQKVLGVRLRFQKIH